MANPLRLAWSSLVRLEDYEAHMANVGQAQANATLVADYFALCPPRKGASILFAGAGAGQMFDFVSPDFLSPYRTTFSDINPQYLEKLELRLAPFPAVRATTVVDDLEASRLNSGFELVLAVLVLEHVDWKKAVRTMCRLSTERVLVVIQQNPQEAKTAMNQHRPVIGSMNIFRDIHPVLVPRAHLESEFAAHDFSSAHFAEKAVLDEKKLLALEFIRQS